MGRDQGENISGCTGLCNIHVYEVLVNLHVKLKLSVQKHLLHQRLQRDS